jgi:type I restriction enzyme S subunit
LFIRSQNVRDGRLSFEDVQYVTPPTGAEGNRTKVRLNDLLITITGNSVGNVALVEQTFDEAYISQHVGLVRLKEPSRGAYVCRYLSPNSPGNPQIAGSQSGQSKPGLNLQNLKDFQIALPPTLSELQAIATALSDVDGLLGGLDRLIAKKRDLKQAAMQQLLTGQTRLPGFHGEWEVKAVHDLSQVGRGRVISHTEISKSSSPTYPVFSSQTSGSGIMGYLDTYDFEGDYVTWTTDGANAGTVFARSGRFNCTNVCGTIKLHDSDHRFVAAALGRVSQSHVSRHLGNPKLMNDVMKKIQITIPKTRAEQTAIAEVLSEMDGELAVLEQRREKTRALKQAMMQELLTGRTRLIESPDT